MKIQFMISMIVAVSMGLAACGKHNDNPSVPEAASPPPAPVIYQVNGMAASDYYGQFLFKPTETCDKPDVFYRFLASEDAKIAVNYHGQDVVAELSVLMYPDHSFKASYLEKDVIEYTDYGYSWKTSRKKIIRGQWQVVETRLELSGLGTAIGVQLGNPGQPGLFLKVNSDLVTPGLAGQTMTVRYVYADHVPVPGADPCE